MFNNSSSCRVIASFTVSPLTPTKICRGEGRVWVEGGWWCEYEGTLCNQEEPQGIYVCVGGGGGGVCVEVGGVRPQSITVRWKTMWRWWKGCYACAVELRRSVLFFCLSLFFVHPGPFPSCTLSLHAIQLECIKEARLCYSDYIISLITLLTEDYKI